MHMKTLSAAILIALLFVIAGCPKEEPAPTDGTKTVDSVTLTPPDKEIITPDDSTVDPAKTEESKADGGAATEGS
jgi:PBP1b-binding outer membrane lipoprotein LpoB